MVNYSVLALVEFMESAKRLQSILCLKELEKYISKKCQKDSAIEVKDATFAWSSISLPQISSKKNKRDLDKINFKSKGNNAEEKLLNYSKKRGELVGVCGGVGSGKSSLLLGLIGQMLLRKGSVAVAEDCAYVGQDSWILNASLRENILLGEHFDAKRYYKVMYACSLTEDVALLPAGDFTEIGERGINLSGGQKQRVSLARALYSNRNIYLFDDCLSAVDAHVGQHIFKWVFKYALKSKTVIFVTHQLQYLPDCNRVMFLRDGRIEEIGSHDELMATSGSYSVLFNKHLETLDQESLGRKHDSKSKTSYFNTAISPLKEDTLIPCGNKVEEKSSQLDSHFNGGRLTSKERSEVGDIPLSLYQEYIEFCGGYFVTFVVVFTFLLSAASAGFGSWWLSVWLGAGSGNTTIVVGNETVVSDNIGDNPDFYLYRTVYGLTVIFILVTAVVRGFAFMKSTILGSSRMHNAVFDKIFHAPMVFFDTTPSGRILNIFSRDMDEVDVRLPTSMGMLLQNIWLILISLLFVALVFPYFLICLLFIAGFFLLIRQVFRNAIRDLKRFENISRSPIFTHISTTVNGLPSIQAFGKQQLFTKKFTKLFDDNTCYFYLFNSAGRWLAVRLDFLALSVTSITALLCICLRNSVSPASAGLALAYAYQLSGIFQYTVRLSTEVEARFTSVQRIITHLKTVPSEAFQAIKGNKPNRNWPRFGVIGRTGSGKSSLGAALFRLVELKRGTIMIDGINIASVGLQDLRSRISIIPQDPLLFIGTIRNNLDPFGKHSDAEIWAVLEKTRLKETIASLEFKLSSPVIENGANFSVGERQLICMARALLRNNKILFLDEATAGIDTETDLKIQDTLREEFKNCTMITVAHRLNTIMNCSRVMVMDNGSVVEFDSPEKLLQDSSSRFANKFIKVPK
ncbi:Multidrug resistance-associated protein 5 [Armadillidium vulgare]|nr:Multidrug resistance-associated protein 5 [Armadillidium vulgare]